MRSIRRLSISVLATASIALAAPAAAQTAVTSDHPYGLDPYKPSDAALLRNYGAALVTQTPLAELATLDPYKPSHAALLRQLGGAIPLWSNWFAPGPAWGPVMPAFGCQPSRHCGSLNSARRGKTVDASQGAAAVPAAPPASSGPTTVATLERPRTNDGVSIRFDGQAWLNAGRAIPLESSGFVRIGEYAGFPVYRRSGASANSSVIYVRTRDDLVTPFRLKP